jgi:BarA-like signal transduction histidine kinase
MVFNATFNNISVSSCRSDLLVEETGKTTGLSQVNDKHYNIMLYRLRVTFQEPEIRHKQQTSVKIWLLFGIAFN